MLRVGSEVRDRVAIKRGAGTMERGAAAGADSSGNVAEPYEQYTMTVGRPRERRTVLLHGCSMSCSQMSPAQTRSTLIDGTVHQWHCTSNSTTSTVHPTQVVSPLIRLSAEHATRAHTVTSQNATIMASHVSVRLSPPEPPMPATASASQRRLQLFVIHFESRQLRLVFMPSPATRIYTYTNSSNTRKRQPLQPATTLTHNN